MKLIRFVGIFLIYLFIQIEANYVPKKNQDIIDIAKVALEELEAIVKEVVDVALGTINGLESDLKGLEETILDVAEVAIDKIGDAIFGKLDEIKAEANALGVDIIDCTEDRENDIKQVFITFLDKTGGCAVGRLDEALGSFADIVVDVQGTNDELKKLSQQLDGCGSDEGCIAQVIMDIVKASVDLLDKIKADVERAEKVVGDLEDYLYECEHDHYNEMEITAQEIFNGIVECVEDKLLHPSVVNVP